MFKKEKCAVFSCLGLGDGLIALVLSNNLMMNDCEVITYHPSLNGLQPWFPTLPIRPFPSLTSLDAELSNYDRFFIFYEKTEWMQAVIQKCLTSFRSKTYVLNPIATANCDYPFWEEGKFDGRKSLVDNLYLFCKDILKLKLASRTNGISPLPGLSFRKEKQRIVIHPTSSREGKNWPREKYLLLSQKLKNNGFEPA
ncbi:MAG: hypothetical protein ACM3JI_01370, partial [Anaerolineae bacterium]